LELQARGERADYAAVLAEIIKRDERDKNRATAPLMAAADAIVLDTTTLDVEAVFKAALAIVMRCAARSTAGVAGR
jgi:cytidylate kinase